MNEFSGLTTQHVIWVREHNRLAKSLHRINPHWSGRTLHEETRRIVGAMWQLCVYGEYLPIILGQAAMDAHGLTLNDHGYWNGQSSSSSYLRRHHHVTIALGRTYSRPVLSISTRNSKTNIFFAAPDSRRFFAPWASFLGILKSLLRE